MSEEMIPFGKYKGKSVEAILDDRSYVEWLLAQSWFKERHANLYTIVINNGQEPVDTPEHNQMQVRFLSDSFALNFFQAAWPDFKITGRWAEEMEVGEIKVLYENNGVDVTLKIKITNKADARDYYHLPFGVEIKPTISDDFPSVLRQIRRYQRDFQSFAVYVRSYTGVGATEEQFRQFFESQDIRVVFERELT